MKTKAKKLSRLTKALLEMADDMHCIGIMDDATYSEIMTRHLGKARAARSQARSRMTAKNKDAG